MCVFTISFTYRFFAQQLVGYVGSVCGAFAAFLAWFQLHATARIRRVEGQGLVKVLVASLLVLKLDDHGTRDRGRR